MNLARSPCSAMNCYWVQAMTQWSTSNLVILIVGRPGTEFLKTTLPAYKKYAGIDLCIVNGENSAPGNGTTPDSAEDLLAYGADVVTGGNHTFRRREFYDYLDRRGCACLRPANYGSAAPGGAS